MRLTAIFNKENIERDKYLSRLFGIFSEKIASLWFRSPYSPYENLGRPTVYKHGEDKGYTLDFTLQDKVGKKIYIAEMKCELEYDNYKYLELKEYKQLKHHTGEAFQRFIAFASHPNEYKVTVSRKPIQASGSILIWGAVNEKGKYEIIQWTNIHDVLSLENMMNDLLHNNENDFKSLLYQYKEWTDYLFEKLSAR